MKQKLFLTHLFLNNSVFKIISFSAFNRITIIHRLQIYFAVVAYEKKILNLKVY